MISATRLRRVATPLAACLAITAAQPVLEATQPPKAPPVGLGAYLEMARRYRGDDLRPVEEIRGWLLIEIERAVDEVRHRGDALREQPSAPGEIAVHDVEAAVLLHAHVAFLAMRRMSLAEAEFHTRMAARLFQWTQAVARQRRKAGAPPITPRIEERDFYLSMTGSSLAFWALRLAEGFAERGVRHLRTDAEMLLLAGCVQEALATQLAVEADGGGARARREAAAKLFEKALAIDDAMAEARLRLGRIRLAQGRATEAELPLEAVARTSPDAGQRYLAWLFLGQLHDRRQRMAQAVDDYERAVALYPDAQAARVGLAWARDRQAGQAVARLTLLEGFVGRQTAEAARDPWWDYPFGPPGLARAALERMHDRVGRP